MSKQIYWEENVGPPTTKSTRRGASQNAVLICKERKKPNAMFHMPRHSAQDIVVSASHNFVIKEHIGRLVILVEASSNVCRSASSTESH